MYQLFLVWDDINNNSPRDIGFREGVQTFGYDCSSYKLLGAAFQTKVWGKAPSWLFPEVINILQYIVIHLVCSTAEEIAMATSKSVVADVYWDSVCASVSARWVWSLIVGAADLRGLSFELTATQHLLCFLQAMMFKSHWLHSERLYLKSKTSWKEQRVLVFCLKRKHVCDLKTELQPSIAGEYEMSRIN